MCIYDVYMNHIYGVYICVYMVYIYTMYMVYIYVYIRCIHKPYIWCIYVCIHMCIYTPCMHIHIIHTTMAPMIYTIKAPMRTRECPSRG